MTTTIQRIAVLRALHLGDLLLAVPALRALRSGFPRAEITLIGLPWAAEFARHYPRYLDRFVPFQGYPGLGEVPVIAERVAAFLAEQRAYGYDLVVQLHGSGRASTPCALALGGRMTAGYYEGARPAGLTLGLPYPTDQPEVLRNLALIRLLNCPDQRTHLEFPLVGPDRAEAARLLAEAPYRGQPRIGIHAGARAASRRWPTVRFAQVADQLAREYGATNVLTGAPNEVAMTYTVAARMRASALNLAGHTSLGGLAAVIASLDLFIANDTGPAHLAEAVGTPSITIFGPADPRRWAPLDPARHPIAREPVACSPCGYTDCPIDHRCLRRIPSARVVAMARALLSGGAAACNA